MLQDALALLAGVTAIQFAPVVPPAGWACAAAALAALWMTWHWKRRRVALVLVGLSLASWHADRALSSRLPLNQSPLLVRARIQIDSLLARREDTVTFDALVMTSTPAVRVRRLRVRWFAAPRGLQATQTCELALKLRAPHGQRNPSSFDPELAWMRASIDALASVQSDAPSKCEATPRSRAPVLWLRQRIVRQLDEWAAGHPSLGILQGLAVGDSSQISQDQWRVFRAVGITHLLAISGAHVGFFGLLAASVVRAGWRMVWPPRAQRGIHVACSVAAILASASYALLAGFSVPTQRTVLMIAVAGVARMAARSLSAVQLLCIALIAVLIWDPTAPLQPGFWLSFGTVAWLFLSQDSGRAWWRSLLTQWSTSLFLLPIGIACFGQASSVAPLINCLAVPATELLIVPLILSALALTPVTPMLSRWLIEHAASGLDWALALLTNASHWAGAPLWWTPLPLAAVALAVSAIVAQHILPLWPLRVLAAAMLANLFFWFPRQMAASEFDLAVFDTGDAMIAALLTRRHSMIYYASSGLARAGDVMESAVIPYLRAAGRNRIDLLVVSRADGAHSSGASSLFREFEVRQVIGGADSIAPCSSDQRWRFDGVSLNVLNPSSESAQGHDASCVIELGNSQAKALLAGEINSQTEAGMLEAGRLGPATLVVVPDHGSHHASSPEFIRAVRAHWAIVCASFDNRFGYPRAEVLRRWWESGAHVRRTAVEGAVVLRVRNGAAPAVPPGERVLRMRYWTMR